MTPELKKKMIELAKKHQEGMGGGANGLIAYWKIITGFTAAVEEMEKIHEEIIKICGPHLDKMWAAKIVGTLLDCDFRDCKQALEKYTGERMSKQRFSVDDKALEPVDLNELETPPSIQDLSKKLREARAKATSGEWQSEPGNEITVLYTTEMRRMICEFDLSYRDPKGPFDCEFVVLAANNITRILDELDRLIEVEKVFIEVMNQMTDYANGFNEKEAHHELCCQVPDLAFAALKRADEIGKGK